jgi:hypothetical protein
MKNNKRYELILIIEKQADISFYANRYDYLRIGKRILDDWNNDTCVGKYLKTIYEQRINKIRKVMMVIDMVNLRLVNILKNMEVSFILILLDLKKRKILANGWFWRTTSYSRF